MENRRRPLLELTTQLIGLQDFETVALSRYKRPSFALLRTAHAKIRPVFPDLPVGIKRDKGTAIKGRAMDRSSPCILLTIAGRHAPPTV
jgi:hypothetical protein